MAVTDWDAVGASAGASSPASSPGAVLASIAALAAVLGLTAIPPWLTLLLAVPAAVGLLGDLVGAIANAMIKRSPPVGLSSWETTGRLVGVLVGLAVYVVLLVVL